jgi:hypothetical protein
MYTYSETEVREISPADKIEPYLDPVLPPAPTLLSGDEPRLLDVYSIPSTKTLHV